MLSYRGSGRRIARIGGDVLYESEVVKLLPEGISSEDSAAMVRQYLNTWALGKLLLLKAEEQLSKSEKDVSEQIEEYRSSLLGFRYEKRYIEERIDTAVGPDEIIRYYEEHPESFTTASSIVKARVVKLSASSPYYDMIRNMMNVTDERDVANLEELCFSSADRYADFDNNWVGISEFAKEAGIDADILEEDISRSRAVEKKVDGKTVLIYVLDRVAPGAVSPLEFNEERIKEALLSKRKQELLQKLEQDLLEEATGNNHLKIYSYDE